MKLKIEITHQAESEIETAYLWIRQDSPIRANKWFEGMVKAIDYLALFPVRCLLAQESGDVGNEVRQLLYGKFRILFIVESDTVFILHVRHGGRQYLGREDF